MAGKALVKLLAALAILSTAVTLVACGGTTGSLPGSVRALEEQGSAPAQLQPGLPAPGALPVPERAAGNC